MPARLHIEQNRLEDFCRSHHIQWLALFGSVLRSDFGVESDVDVLVKFQANRVPGFEFFLLEEALSEIFGHRVDLNTPGFLSKYIRDEVLRNAQVLYDAAR